MLWFLQHVWEVSIVTVAILIAVYIWRCVWKIRSINENIKDGLEYLKTPREFQDIDAEFKNYNRLESVWRNFEKSLIKTNDIAYSTTDAAEFFTTQNLTREMNMTFWQAYGGIFTGLGILGTFAGLTFGLSGINMTSGDIDALKDGIANLLSGVESAFVTSLVGIACAIVYNISHHFLMKNFQGNVQALTKKLDEIFPRRSAEYWLAESCKITVDQTNSVKEIGEQVAEMIRDGIADELGEFSEKICAAIENLGAGGSEAVGEVFSERVGSQMDRFSTALDKFSDRVEKNLADAQELSNSMNQQLLNTLQTLHETLNQQAEKNKADQAAASEQFLSTLANLSKTLQEVADNTAAQQKNSAKNFESLVANLTADLKDFAQGQKEILGNVTSSNAEQISEALKAFNEIVNRHNDTTQKTFAQIQSLLSETERFLQQVNTAGTSLRQAAEPVRQSTLQLAQNLSDTSAQMNRLATANRSTNENLSLLTTRLNNFVSNFDGIAKELETSTKIISDSLEHYNYEMSKGLSDALTEFDKRLSDAVGHIQNLMEDLTDALEDLKRIRR